MKKLLSLFFLPFAVVSAAETMDITTRSGKVFEDARLERVNPDGIDIGYVNEKGHYVLKGLRFQDLPEELQKKFGYDPEKSRKFETEVKKYEGKDIDKVADEEKTRLERITEQIKAKFAGEKITLKPADLRYAIHAWRRSVEITPVKDTKTGCVVKVDKVVSGRPIQSELVLVDGVHLPAEGSWSGFLYPTGMKAVYEKKQIPVFTGNLDDSAEILTRYLEIYAEYAASGRVKNDSSAETAVSAPDQAASAPQRNAAKPEEQTVPDQWTNDNAVTYYPFGSYYGFVGDGVYFISGNFAPVAWWNRFHPDRPPHRPPPGKPDRPHRPDRPGRPGRPERPAKPVISGKPGTTSSRITIRQKSRPAVSSRQDQQNTAGGRNTARPGTSQTTLRQTPVRRGAGKNGSFILGRNRSGSYEIRRSGAFRQAVPAVRRSGR